MYMGSVAGEPYLEEPHEAHMLPKIAGGTEWTPAWQRGIIVFDYGNEAKVEGAVEFLRFFTTPENNLLWCQKCNYQSALKTTLALPEYTAFLADNTSLACLEPAVAGAFPAIPDTDYVRTALNDLLASVGAGVSVKDAMDAAVKYVADNVQ